MIDIAREANNTAAQAKSTAAQAKRLQHTGILLGGLALVLLLILAIWLGTRDEGVSQDDYEALKTEVATKANADKTAEALNSKASAADLKKVSGDVAKINNDMYDENGTLKLATAADLAKVKKTADIARRMSKANQENLATVESTTNIAITALRADAEALKAEVAALKAAPSKVSGGPVKVRINKPDGQVDEFDLRD